MNEKILEKIKKCLRLAQSSNANEAAAALRQAQKLMDIHGISATDVQASDIESYSTKSGTGMNPPSYVASLANIIALAFGANWLYRKSYDLGRWVGSVEYYGCNGSAEVCGYAFEVLSRQLKRDRTKYLAKLSKSLKRATKMRRGDLYASAWVHVVSKQITPHTRTSAESDAIKAYESARFRNGLTTSKAKDRTAGMRPGDGKAIHQGLQDGSKIQFHQGVKGRNQAALEGGCRP